MPLGRTAAGSRCDRNTLRPAARVFTRVVVWLPGEGIRSRVILDQE